MSGSTIDSAAPDKCQSTKAKRRTILIGLITVVVIALLCGLGWFSLRGKNEFGTYPGASVSVQPGTVPAGLKIGVVVSYTEDPAQGKEWLGNAEGITVANWRTSQDGNGIDVVTVSDQGSEKGSKEAIDSLKSAGVSIIVAPTSGTHTQALAKAAHEAKIGIIFPYENSPVDPIENTWYGIPSQVEINESIVTHAKEHNCQKLYADTDSLELKNIPVHSQEVDEKKQFTADFLKKLKSDPNSCLLFSSATPHTTDLIVQARHEGIYLPTYLASEGRSDEFTKSLSTTDEIPNNLYAVGWPSSSVIAVTEPSKPGTPAISFTEAIAQMKNTKISSSIFKDDSFSKHADAADGSSHDAFLAAIQAAVNAKSTDPIEVGKALHGLTSPTAQMIETGELSFAKSTYKPVQIVQLIDVNGQLLWAPSGK